MKAVEDSLQYFKTYVARILSQTAGRYFKHVEQQVIRLQTKSLDQFTVLLKLKSTFKRITRLAAFQSLRIGKHWTYLFRKFEQVARSTSEQYIFEISKQFQSWIFNDVWWQTCAPTISLKFLWHIHCINKSRYQKFR